MRVLSFLKVLSESDHSPEADTVFKADSQLPLQPVPDDPGDSTVALGITERQSVEEALYQEKERAQVTLASIGDGVIRTGPDGEIDYHNPVAERLTGWHSEEALGRQVSEVFQIIDELTRRPLGDPVARCLAEARVVESPGPALLLSADGKEY